MTKSGSWLVLLSLASSALIAFICLQSGRPIALAAAPVGAAVVVLLFTWLAGALGARRAARKLERGWLEQGAAYARGARPDVQDELNAEQQRFERALNAWKTAVRRGDALVSLPWYALVGPPGAGKASALRQAGLQFPETETEMDTELRVRGVGGSRNCNVWFSREALLLDTAGAPDDERPEWLNFLQLLRSQRRAKPLNGLIAAVSIGDVVNATTEDVEVLAEALRARLEEIAGELQVALPVYLLLTKCDQVEGFSELFGSLRASERDRVLGFTLPFSGARSLDDAFDELTNALRHTAIVRMAEERSQRARQLAFAFPEQLAAMRANLALFVEQLFGKNERLPLRGVYFSSARQEGPRFNLLFEPDPDTAPNLLDPKSYFLRELFSRVIFADKDLASVSVGELARKRRRRALFTGAFALATLATGVAPAVLLVRHVLQLRATAQLLAAAGSGGQAPARPELSAQGRALVADLERYERGLPQLFSKLGLYTGDQVLPPLRRFTAELVREQLVLPLVESDRDALHMFATRFESAPRASPNRADHDALYAALKLHLLLTNPSFAAPHARWLEDELAKRWSEELGREAPRIAHAYVRATQSCPELAIAQDTDAMRRVRAVLRRASSAQQTLETIVARAGGFELDLQALSGAANVFEGKRQVRGAFTRRGYESAVRELFASGAPEHADEPWVLGLREDTGSTSERSARLAELEALYFRAYAQEWRNLLDGLRTQSPPLDGPAALALLNDLTRGEPPPIAKLIQSLAENVRLQPSAAGAAETLIATSQRSPKRTGKRPAPRDNKDEERASERFGAAEVAQAFAELLSFGAATQRAPYSAYHEQLVLLRDALQAKLDNPLESQALERRIEAAQTRVRSLIDAQAASLRPLLEALLWPPIQGLRDGAGRDGSVLGQKWCKEVVAPFEKKLAERYPFNPEGEDARLEDFDAFYRPESGVLWRFVHANLKDQVHVADDHYAFTPKYALGGGLYTKELVEFLDRSLAISRAFYSSAAKAPRADFSLRIHGDAPDVRISVGGKQIGFDKSLPWQALSWPGPQAARGSAITARGRSVRSQAGAWGLFRMLEHGTSARTADDAISVTWRLADDAALWIDLRPESSVSPFFDLQALSSQPHLLYVTRAASAQVPQRIALGQPPCKP